MKRTIVILMLSAVALVTLVTPAAAKSHAPRACLTALRESESIAGIESQFASAVSTYLTSIGDSAGRHASDGDVTAFIDEQSSAVTTLNDAITTATSDLHAHVAAYKVAAATCRNAS